MRCRFERTYGGGESDKSAFNRPAASSSAATSHHKGRRRTRHEDSKEHGGRCIRSSKKRGCSSVRVDDDPTSLTSFDMIAEPLMMAPRNALVTPSLTKALKRHSRIFHPWRCAYYHPPPVKCCPPAQALPSLFWGFCETKRTGKYSSAINCRLNFNQPAPPCWGKAIQIKSRQTLVFDLGGCTGRLRAGLFLGERRALFRGELVWALRWYLRPECFC